jgi:acyl-homoserine lactone acylase PvdQ
MAAIPFLLCGRTKHLAWGSTILYSDNADFFEEKVTDHNNGSYSYEFKGK